MGRQRQGVPHDLGVLSHYKAVVWYLGDNHLTQDLEDVFTTTPFGDLLDLSVAEREQYLTLAVRDFLNEGGKLVHAGETAQFEGSRASATSSAALLRPQRRPAAECVVTRSRASSTSACCWPTTSGSTGSAAFTRVEPARGADRATASPSRSTATTPTLAGTPTNPLDEVGLFHATSDVLPPDQFPQFASSMGASKFSFTGDPFAPIEGTHFAGAAPGPVLHAPDRTIDLTGHRGGRRRTCSSSSLQHRGRLRPRDRRGAHGGPDDWTTLPTSTAQPPDRCPTQCEQGFLLEMHPFLTHYLTPGNPCTPSGSTARELRFTGTSQGWKPVKIDLQHRTRARRSSWRSRT
jgi:hypothetical protein